MRYLFKLFLFFDRRRVMCQKNNFDRDFRKQCTADIMQRLQNIAYQIELYNNTMSQEKAVHMFFDEVQALSEDFLTTNDIRIYMKKMNDNYLIINHKWKKLCQAYGKEALIPFLQNQPCIQDDTKTHKTEYGNRTDSLNQNGIKIKKINTSEISKIKNLLGTCKNQYYNAWKIENAKTQAEFTDFIHAEDVDTKLLCHGSGNENWWNIINFGLKTHPKDVMIRGKMFGKGIYFATNAEKALFFTSINIPNKRRRLSNISFIGIYEVAYGIPYDVFVYNPEFSNFNYNKLQIAKKGSHCLHAHKGGMLKNEEIIVYKEEQTTIRYLVELRQSDGAGGA